MVHKAVDEVLDKLDAAFEEEPVANLVGTVGAISRAPLRVSRCQHESRHCASFPSFMEQLVIRCPCCDKLLHRKRFEPKQVSPLQGSFVLQRPYFYCDQCRLGFHPLDETLQLAEEFHQHDIQECVTDMAVRMPYREAAEVFQRAVGITVSTIP